MMATLALLLIRYAATRSASRAGVGGFTNRWRSAQPSWAVFLPFNLFASTARLLLTLTLITAAAAITVVLWTVELCVVMA
jgi:hypothetical protein